MELNTTADLAGYVADLDVSQLPGVVVDQARDCLLDSLSCMLGGTRVKAVRQAAEVVLTAAAPGRCAVPGQLELLDPSFAAYAAALYADALDFNDSVDGVGHPGASVVGTALAVAQERDASGLDLLRAIVAGYEVAIRIARGRAPSRERSLTVRGQPWAVFGSAAAAASLLGLRRDAVAAAFGLAAQHAAVPFDGKWYERPMSPLKNNYGWAALGGVLAAKLAANNVVSTPAVFDGPNGFWAMSSSDRWDPKAVSHGLGREYAILDVGFKPFPTCRFTHPALRAVRRAIDQERPDPDTIERVIVRTADWARVFADYAPRTQIEAQYSLPWAIASLLAGRDLTSFRPDDPEVGRLARRIQIETSPEIDRQFVFSSLPVEITISEAGGRTRTLQGITVPGSRQDPLPAGHLETKYVTLAEPVLGPKRTHALLSAVQDAEPFPAAAALAPLYRLPA
jgi:2-methylcitrate dehydratase PrpD